MLDNILSQSKEFIAIKSDPDNKPALNKILGLALLSLKGHTVEKFERNGVKSALVYNTKKRPKKFKVLFNTHLDVIPGKDSQYKPRVKGNRLYGVGAMDMKANLACVISVFNEVANKVSYPLALQLVTDEEIGGFDGTGYQIEKGMRTDFVLASEPTNFDIVNKAKGVLWLRVFAQGRSAHSAYPWRGENAIFKMNKFLADLHKRYPNPDSEKWVTTVNVSSIETKNKTFNKIPDECSASLDIRFVPEDQKTLIKNIKKILPKGFKLDVVSNESALYTDSENEYIRLLQKASKQVLKKKSKLRGANGTSDARHFTDVGCPGIEFGPIGGGIGSDSEWVDIPSLKKYTEVLKKFLLFLD